MTDNSQTDNEQERQFNDDQYQMLLRCSEKKDMTEWNEWRMPSQIGVPIFLQNARLKKAYLAGANLSGVHFEGAKFGGANLEGANLNGAHLQGAILREAKLKGADLRKAHLDGTNLIETNLENADLRRAYLNKATLRKTQLEGAKLRKVHLIGARFEGIDFVGVHFEGSDLSGANLEGAKLRGSYFEGAKFLKSNLMNADVREANFEGANLAKALLVNTDFFMANLKKAKLIGANLKGADLRETNLESADLTESNLEGANIYLARLKDTCLEAVIVDGKTLLWSCIINENTDFKGVGLDSARVEPGLKERLKYNIRRDEWQTWYKDKKHSRWPMHLFWKLSDYGGSTTRIIGWFFGLSFIFALLYFLCGLIDGQGVVADLFVDQNVPTNQKPVLINPWVVPFRAIYFSIVTMTTLGFGDMYAMSKSIWGHVLLTIQVLLGYIILGALITRFGILFMSSGPMLELAKAKEKTKPQDQ